MPRRAMRSKSPLMALRRAASSAETHAPSSSELSLPESWLEADSSLGLDEASSKPSPLEADPGLEAESSLGWGAAGCRVMIGGGLGPCPAGGCKALWEAWEGSCKASLVREHKAAAAASWQSRIALGGTEQCATAEGMAANSGGGGGAAAPGGGGSGGGVLQINLLIGETAAWLLAYWRAAYNVVGGTEYAVVL